MSKYTTIIQELQQINDAKFQIICDQFMSAEYKGDLNSTGTVMGKEKTKKGKPDSFLRMPDGNYILGEYTTQSNSSKAAFLKKLEKDLNDCLQLDKFNIRKEQVNLVLLCCNSKLEIAQIEYLKGIANIAGFELRTISIDTLAHFLFSKGKSLARDLLGIPFDTGQILNKEQFLEQYHRQNISTRLDYALLGRELQLQEMVNSIVANNITILKGSAGVGKSRLAMKAIDEFVSGFASYKPFYIVQKNNSIAEDLSTYLDDDSNYILFIDDANRQIDNLLSILHQQVEKQEDKIKIVITVRDYAKDEIVEKCKAFNPALIHIDKLTDETIGRILKSDDFQLQDEQVIQRIVEISKGNPRLAIMAAIVIVKKGELYLLQDVSNIYDEYYGSYIKDKPLFKDRDALKVLGLLSFFHAVDLRSDEAIKPLKTFNIAHDKFIEVIYQLEDLEMVEIYMKETVKISEQVLATYFFYRVFIVNKLLSFDLLLKDYFQIYPHRMKDAVYPCEIAFGKEKVIGGIKKELFGYWKIIEADNTEAIRYLDIFGKYFAEQVFSYVSRQIQKEPVLIDDNIQYELLVKNYGNYNFASRVLESFFYSHDKFELLVSVELAIDYAWKFQYLYGTVVKSLQNALIITNEDIQHGLKRQQLVFDKLGQQIERRKIDSHVFYHLHADIILGVYFTSKAYAKNKEGRWELITLVKDLRKQLWNNIIENYSRFPSLIGDVMIGYLDTIPNSNEVMVQFDHLYMLLLIEKNLSPNSFADCVFVQVYLKAIGKTGVLADRLDLRMRFENSTYKICILLSQARFFNKNLLSTFGDYEKIEAEKIAIIKKDIQIRDLDDFTAIYGKVVEIMAYRYSGKFGLRPLVEYLLAGIFEKDLSLGFKSLDFYLSRGNISNIYPVSIYRFLSKEKKAWTGKLYSLINAQDYNDKEIWIERYFNFIPTDFVNAQAVQQLLHFYKNRIGKTGLYTGMFANFLGIDQRIHYKIFKIAVSRYTGNKERQYELGYQFFQDDPELVDRDIALCKLAYLQQTEINKEYDHDCSELTTLFRRDELIVDELLDQVISSDRYLFSGYHGNLNRLWLEKKGAQAIYRGLVQLVNSRKYIGFDHVGTIFFQQLEQEQVDNALELLKGFALEFINNAKALNLVLDITRNTLKPFYLDLVQFIISRNIDIILFKELQWCNNHFSSNGEAIWGDFKAAELRRIHQTIRDLPDARNYILHLEYLELQISYEEMDSYRERKMRFMGLR